MKTNFLKKSIIALFIFSSLTVLAQPGDGSDNGGVDDDGSNDTTGSGAPIDGGLSLLLAAGAIYGAKKVNDRRNK